MSIFEEQKKWALERLQRRGADEEVKETLEKINRLGDFFTTSSCSGRIALMCLPEIGAKRAATFIGKWHHAVRKEEVLAAMNDVKPSMEGDIWLLAQSPIMHVACRGLENATALLQITLESGFKYRGIKAVGRIKKR